jgi:hypothetical protein
VYASRLLSFFLFPLSLFQTEIRGDAILTFQDAQLKLLVYVRSQIRNGDLTERGFARLIGISQPHVHNVLKGVRNLSPNIFDLALKYLHLSLLDLVPSHELEAHLRRRRIPTRTTDVPFLDRPIGPGMPWSAILDPHRTFALPLPAVEIQANEVHANLVMARLVPDPAMRTLAAADLVLLDTTRLDTSHQSEFAPRGLYVVERGSETLVRYIRPGAHRYYLATDATLDTPADWESLPVSSTELGVAVKARVRWIGQEYDRDVLPQRGRILDQPTSW